MLRKAVKTVLINSSGSAAQRIKSAPMSAAQKEKWDLFAGVVVERLPIISKSLTPLEQQYADHLAQIEYEQSYKSDFEMQHEKDKLIAELHQKGKLDNVDATVQLTAQDLKDLWKDELSRFQFSSRITEADRKNDTKSLNRKLEETLVLLVEQQIGDKKHLVLPQGQRNSGETLRQTAERVLQQCCGLNLNVQFYGNSPCGFYKYKYPLKLRQESIGAKVFFFRAAYKQGSIDVADQKAKTNFEWLDKTELINSKLKGDYANSVKQFLL